MDTSLELRCRRLLNELGLIGTDDALVVEPLSGGVASDIAKVTTQNETYCVKFALPKLRVKADWFAPVERNFAEYCWLKSVADISPESALKLYGHSSDDHGFAMAFLSGQHTYLLKQKLFDGKGHIDDAQAIGDLLGKIHQASSSEHYDTQPFQNQDDFHAIRIEPYLLYTAVKHPDLKDNLHDMADDLYKARSVLIHGDVSPKNIMFSNNTPYILDAECATMGDPAFDLAFCLNHFILKAIYVPSCHQKYLSFCEAFWAAYKPYVTWENPSRLEKRLVQLLPMLMLARVDGKSPVEYFNKAQQQDVRDIAIPLIKQPHNLLSTFVKVLQRGNQS